MRTVEEITQDLKDCYSCESKECLFPIPTTCGKPQDASVIAYEAEMGKAIINLFGIDRLEEICNAEREGRCVVLNEDVVIAAVRKAILINTDEKRYRYELGKACLTSCCKDAYKYLLQLTRKAAETALREREQDDD